MKITFVVDVTHDSRFDERWFTLEYVGENYSAALSTARAANNEEDSVSISAWCDGKQLKSVWLDRDGNIRE